MPIELHFRKTGQEIKVAVGNRVAQLQQRLDRRNQALSEFMADPARVRSYMVRSSQNTWRGHPGHTPSTLYSQSDISSEEMEEVTQLCRRIFEIEQELHRLQLIRTHLVDDQVFELPFADLIAYGFDLTLESE